MKLIIATKALCVAIELRKAIANPCKYINKALERLDIDIRHLINPLNISYLEPFYWARGFLLGNLEKQFDRALVQVAVSTYFSLLEMEH